MNTRTIVSRGVAGLAGGFLLLGVAGTAMAAELDSNDVDVNVEITELPGGGTLSMTVAGDSTELTEEGSTSVIRQFTGTLPTVTVTDTRDPEDIPAEAGWYVVGSTSDFTNTAGDVIPAANLGWQPRLIDGGDTGLVAEGDRVETIVDEGEDAVGLVDQELLALTNESAEVAPTGPFTANADLFLRTAPTVEAGDYSSTLTLSLFE
ncbi:hypothetical protein [Rathayibacter sp. VKM Ac-2630]|uniref:hypothetical protein n=1 Tax=Rathayibacter sp. VKM Ac-2630 TaxID=1938617 RepID=UPI000980C8BD|nr:hypothetical protein [Rathayibacter sp. VKM Ac-2630]OOB92051.1 hypothetical protein B0T42_02160 [Rathayibacter sp. VKM Ac-2630]